MSGLSNYELSAGLVFFGRASSSSCFRNSAGYSFSDLFTRFHKSGSQIEVMIWSRRNKKWKKQVAMRRAFFALISN